MDAGGFSAGPELSLLKLRVCLTPSRRQMEQFWKSKDQNGCSSTLPRIQAVSYSTILSASVDLQLCVCASLAAEWGIYIYINSIK